MQITFFITLKFWVEDLMVRSYKDYVKKNIDK